MQVLYGLERLPQNIPDPLVQQHGVTLGAGPLRFNSYPLPERVMSAEFGAGHQSRILAAQRWLHSLCGDYSPGLRTFVDEYLAFVASQLSSRKAELERRTERFRGLYEVEDWAWSALRPLPRAWIPVGGALLKVDVLFWDGQRPIAVFLNGAPPAIASAGQALVVELRDRVGDPLDIILPETMHRFWEEQILPSSPFRRPTPTAPLPADGGTAEVDTARRMS